MASKKGKLATLGATATVAVAGGVAELKGVFRSGAEDVSHVRISEHPPGMPADTPSPGFRPPETPAPSPVPSVEHGSGELIAEGNNDPTAKEIICFAYQRYRDATTGSVAVPSEDDFVNTVVAQLAPADSAVAYRMKAQSLYQTLSDPNTNWQDVASQLC